MGLLGSFSQGIEQLTITHEEPMLQVVNAAGNPFVMFTDGRSLDQENEGGGKTKIRTRWKKSRVVFQVTYPVTDGQSASANLTYELARPDQLMVTTTISVVGAGGRASRPLTIKRVYDRLES